MLSTSTRNIFGLTDMYSYSYSFWSEEEWILFFITSTSSFCYKIVLADSLPAGPRLQIWVRVSLQQNRVEAYPLELPHKCNSFIFSIHARGLQDMQWADKQTVWRNDDRERNNCSAEMLGRCSKKLKFNCFLNIFEILYNF